jgi:hypothetical protein
MLVMRVSQFVLLLVALNYSATYIEPSLLIVLLSSLFIISIYNYPSFTLFNLLVSSRRH